MAIYYYTAGPRPAEEVNADARKRSPRTTLYHKVACGGLCAAPPVYCEVETRRSG